MFGSPATTEWGAKRASDGHAQPYPTDQYFEIVSSHQMILRESVGAEICLSASAFVT